MSMTPTPDSDVHYWLSDDSVPRAVIRERVSERREQLAKQRRYIEEEERRLSTIWNSILPINQLPQELIVDIFIACDDPAQTWPFGRSKIGWIHLTRVCRYWREVACASPNLWRSIHVRRGSAWTELCLIRSAPCTIDVSFDDSRLPPSTFDLLRPHFNRIRTLTVLPVDMTPHLPALLSILNKGLHSLENLHVSSPVTTSTERVGVELTSQLHPNLRRVQLGRSTIPHDPGVYSNLRSLTLTDCTRDGISFHQFLDFVSGSPIEELNLRKVLHQLSIDDASTSGSTLRCGPPIDMPRLRRVKLHNDPPHVVSHFFSHIAVPSTARVLVKASCIRNGDNTQETLSALLPRPHARSLSLLSQATEISLIVDHIYMLRISCPEKYAYAFVRLEVRTDHIGWTPSLRRAFQDVVAICSGAPIKTLNIEGYRGDEHESNDWPILFEGFPALQSLTLEGDGNTSDIWQALHPTPASATADKPVVHIPCPSLRSVRYDGAFPLREDIMSEIVECLRDRAKYGTRLELLQFTLYHVRSTDYRTLMQTYCPELKELVTNVIH